MRIFSDQNGLSLREQRSNLAANAPYLAADCRIALRAPCNDDLLLDPSDFEPREMWNFYI
jgi:hypothetical protein